MRRAVWWISGLFLGTLILGGCAAVEDDERVDPKQKDSLEAPEVGACRDLTPADLKQGYNAGYVVDCSEEHTAQTFAVGPTPDEFAEADYDDPELAAWAADTCTDKFAAFLGADESVVMRALVSWAWFGPSPDAWEEGARWYRCDVVGGGERTEELAALPTDARQLLGGKDVDRWMACVAGDSVADAARIPCSEPHQWRAVTTIKVGQEQDAYPGDEEVQKKTRSFCSSSVEAWLDYPVTFDYAFTWFGEPEWDAGGRRSICWAKTDR